jgi:hypothetical protein
LSSIILFGEASVLVIAVQHFVLIFYSRRFCKQAYTLPGIKNAPGECREHYNGLAGTRLQLSNIFIKDLQRIIDFIEYYGVLHSEGDGKW